MGETDCNGGSPRTTIGMHSSGFGYYERFQFTPGAEIGV